MHKWFFLGFAGLFLAVATSAQDSSTPPSLQLKATSDTSSALLRSEVILRTSQYRNPDWGEVGIGLPTQDHPICVARQLDHSYYHFYRCGVVHDPLEPKETIWVAPGNYRLRKRIVDWKFFLWEAAAIGTSVADVELTQYDLRHHLAVEGNPILGQSRAQAYSVIGGISVLQIWATYKRHKAVLINEQAGILRSSGIGRLPWWFAVAVQTGAHTIGIISGIPK